MKKLFFTIAFFLLSAPQAFAKVDGETQIKITLDDVIRGAVKDIVDSPLSVITNVSNFLLGLVGLLAVGALIISGVRYALAAGNSSSMESAKTSIFYALVGLVIVLLAYTILQTINLLLTR